VVLAVLVVPVALSPVLVVLVVLAALAHHLYPHAPWPVSLFWRALF
jgi:hypothetical protein